MFCIVLTDHYAAISIPALGSQASQPTAIDGRMMVDEWVGHELVSWRSKKPCFSKKKSFSRKMGHFLTDMSNRVEHQKQNQTAFEKWLFGLVFGVQLGLRQTLIKSKEG